MSYKTINVSRETYERLQAYKVAGKSFDEVLWDLMEEVDPERFYRKALEIHRKRLQRMRAGRYLDRRALEQELKKD